MQQRYQIASRLAAMAGGKDLMKVDADSSFGQALRNVIRSTRPRRIIETGTYLGTGTTRVIAEALRDFEIDSPEFASIEVNPKHHHKAAENLRERGLRVELINGLSVPRIMLPSIEKIEQQFVRTVLADNLIVDHEESDRAAKYFGETAYPQLPDDLLGKLLRRFEYKPDLILLDSAGHIGFAEFKYVLDLLDGACSIALDDVRHIKHFRSVEQLKQDRRFQILDASDEKFGYCIARFDPGGANSVKTSQRRI